MKNSRPKRSTRQEREFVADMTRRSAFELIDQGLAEVVDDKIYPEPLRRFLERERMMVHVKLSARSKKRLEERSRSSGVSAEELAKRWIEQGIRRSAM